MAAAADELPGADAAAVVVDRPRVAADEWVLLLLKLLLMLLLLLLLLTSRLHDERHDAAAPDVAICCAIMLLLLLLVLAMLLPATPATLLDAPVPQSAAAWCPISLRSSRPAISAAGSAMMIDDGRLAVGRRPLEAQHA